MKGRPHAVVFGFVPSLRARASDAYAAEMHKGLRAALDAHPDNRDAAAESVHMHPEEFTRACRRYGATTPDPVSFQAHPDTRSAGDRAEPLES